MLVTAGDTTKKCMKISRPTRVIEVKCYTLVEGTAKIHTIFNDAFLNNEFFELLGIFGHIKRGLFSKNGVPPLMPVQLVAQCPKM